jgi:hypothetical protein
VKSFKLSRDPKFFPKLHDIVGLYLHPPAKALVLSVEEKSPIQALDRTQPVLPMRPGVPERQTHDYTRHRTTTLFAALNVLSGEVLGGCMPRHRHQEFLRFLERIERSTPRVGELVRAIMEYIRCRNRSPRPFVWTTSVRSIAGKVRNCNKALETGH